MTTISATYSPEDNKLRLYASTRLDAETYQRVSDAGFRWAPKQELFLPRHGTTPAKIWRWNLRARSSRRKCAPRAATGWQSHTMRSAMAGALKNKLGLEVTFEKVENRGQVYHIA